MQHCYNTYKSLISFGKKNVAKLTVSEIWLPLIKLNILTFNEYKSVTCVTIEIS